MDFFAFKEIFGSEVAIFIYGFVCGFGSAFYIAYKFIFPKNTILKDQYCPHDNNLIVNNSYANGKVEKCICKYIHKKHCTRYDKQCPFY